MPKVVQEWSTPKNKYEIRSCLVLFTHYRCFICSFINTAKPLTKLTEEKQAFLWTPEVEAAFQMLKEALCTAPILAYPQPRERFIVDTDVSNVGIGTVFSQVEDEWE
jgi:hypothetical protein